MNHERDRNDPGLLRSELVTEDLASLHMLPQRREFS